jgi:uptake hydrogenase large subunit
LEETPVAKLAWPPLEQEICLDASVIDGRLAVERLVTTRASGVAGALAAQPVDQIPQRLTQLFPLCGTAHAIAATTAVESALRIDVSPAQYAFRKFLLLAEHSAALGWRFLMDWPPLLDATPLVRACAEIRRAAAAIGTFAARAPWTRIGGGRLRIDREDIRGASTALARMLLGLFPEAAGPLLSWKSLAPALERGTSTAAQVIMAARAGAMTDYGAHDRRILPALDADWFAQRLAADPRFGDTPTFDGAPAEVGAFAARRHPLIGEAAGHWGPTLATRLLAAALDTVVIAGQLLQAVDALADDDPTAADLTRAGQGAGLVETARGPLSYYVDVADAGVLVLRNVAPTEWNFHPDGPFMGALATAPRVADPLFAARLLAASFDPCVPFRIETPPAIRHAANSEHVHHA